jgi:hypothetical protein
MLVQGMNFAPKVCITPIIDYNTIGVVRTNGANNRIDVEDIR